MNSSTNINRIQVVIGLVTLFFGCAVYAVRSPDRFYLDPKYFSCLQLSDGVLSAVKIVGGNLPDFFHPFAFILITAGLISSNNKISQFFVCFGWFLLESFFELGQNFKENYLSFPIFRFDNIPFSENTKNFFLFGTFDVLDMFAIFAGTVSAFCVLLITSQRRKEE